MIQKQSNAKCRHFQVGDQIIYRLAKHSRSPGRRAKEIRLAHHGETYEYVVAKFWIVSDVHRDDALIARTRRGKLRVLSCNDPNLRRAHWWERIYFRRRFPAQHVRVGMKARTAERFVWSGDGYRGRIQLRGKMTSAVSRQALAAAEPCLVVRQSDTTLTVARLKSPFKKTPSREHYVGVKRSRYSR